MQRIVVIGSGFAGIAASCFLAKAGCDVTVIDQLDGPGGRARQLKMDGFTFDRGPSWYWMPDVFERFFALFGKSVRDYYLLERLDPSYRVYTSEEAVDIPARLDALKDLFEQYERGAARQLDKFLAEAEYKYRKAIHGLVYKPGLSFLEYTSWDTINGFFRLDIFNSIESHVAKYFTHPFLRRLMEFPILFLGATPSNTPALYSLMNYADIIGGTWYPKGGFFSVVDGMYRLAKELGVRFHFSETVEEIVMEDSAATIVRTNKSAYQVDAVVGAADYHFIEQSLIPSAYQSYSSSYWDSRKMAPSSLLFYVGLNKKLNNVRHHSLFLDSSFDVHAREIYQTKQWPTDPLFYVSAASITDKTIAPSGCENLVFLIPVAAGLHDDGSAYDKYFELVTSRFQKLTGNNMSSSVTCKSSFGVKDFMHAYNSFKGNAYGLANTLSQTAILRPSCRSKKVKNLFYTGQLTVPGPGVPPSLISGEVVANVLLKSLNEKKKSFVMAS